MACLTSTNCGDGATPEYDPDTNSCVECLSDDHCGNLTPRCDPAAHEEGAGFLVSNLGDATVEVVEVASNGAMVSLGDISVGGRPSASRFFRMPRPCEHRKIGREHRRTAC